MKTLLSLAFLISFVTIKAQSVTVDESFANSGVLINNNTSSFGDFALQSIGKIIVAGPQGKTINSLKNFIITRYNVDGSLDTGFGIKGYTGNGNNMAQVFTIAIQKDDAIVAVGRTTTDLKIVRFTKNGDLDKSFGKNGSVIFGAGKNAFSYIGGLVIQPDGKIVLCAYSIFSNYFKVGFLARYLSDGKPDESFGSGGATNWSFPDNENNFAATSLALQTNGQILVGWFYGDSSIIYRYNSNSDRDLTFGNNGTAHFQNSDNVVAGFKFSKLIIQPNGKIIGAGYASDNAGKLYMAAGRLNSNGSIDDSFGNNGIQHISFTQKVSTIDGAALQTDGKIIIAGTVKSSGATYAMARLTNNGDIDSDFGANGRLVTVTDKYSECNGILLQLDNKILLGGNTGLSTSNFLLIRYNNDVVKKQIVWESKPSDKNNFKINLSPNPAVNNLLIEGLTTNEKIKISVVDFAGNIKLQAVANSNTFNLNIASLKAGNYLLKVETNNSITTKAFIKQ
ncbi:MAG: T9SS type A sorting domain-containing protein [Parafilimonas sp.]